MALWANFSKSGDRLGLSLNFQGAFFISNGNEFQLFFKHQGCLHMIGAVSIMFGNIFQHIPNKKNNKYISKITSMVYILYTRLIKLYLNMQQTLHIHMCRYVACHIYAYTYPIYTQHNVAIPFTITVSVKCIDVFAPSSVLNRKMNQTWTQFNTTRFQRIVPSSVKNNHNEYSSIFVDGAGEVISASKSQVCMVQLSVQYSLYYFWA